MQEIDVTPERKNSESGDRYLCNVRTDAASASRRRGGPGHVVVKFAESLDEDGLPPVGLRVEYGDPLYCILDSVRHLSLLCGVCERVNVRAWMCSCGCDCGGASSCCVPVSSACRCDAAECAVDAGVGEAEDLEPQGA